MVVCMSVCLSVSVSVCERGVRGVRVKDGNEGKKRRTNTALSFLGQNTEMHSFMCRCRHQRCVCLCAQNNTALHQLFFFFFPPFTTDQKHNSMDPELRKVGEGGLSCWNACVYFGLVTMLLICFGYFFLSHA